MEEYPMKKSLFITVLLFAANSFAAEKGHTGMTLEVAVSGFFSPEISSAEVKAVESGSPADMQGVKVGDMLIEIEGCLIPGCPANKAKKYMSQSAGAIVALRLHKQNGEDYSANIELK
jgi:C-terminal processing protease CtpA/Prc